MYILPVTSNPNQIFTSTIPVDSGSIRFNFFLRYNTESGCWVLDILDSSNNGLVSGINLVTGVNLLEQYSYLKLGSLRLIKVDTSLTDDLPTEYNLGTSFVIVWGDTV